MTRAASLALLLTALAATPAARADCEGAAATSCARVQTFEPDQMQRFGPNQPLHAVVQLVGVAQLGGEPALRGALGPGVLFGWSPFGSQIFRVSAGGDALFGEWAGRRLGGVTLEPKVRLDLRETSGLLGVGVFGQATFPWFAEAGSIGGGGGGGVSLTLLNRVMIDVDAQWFALPNDFSVATDKRTSGGRLGFAIGGDFVTICGGEGIPPEAQAQVDLRCRTLAAAFSVRKAMTDPLCVQAVDALAAIDIATAEPGATDAFITKLPAPFRGALETVHKDGQRCIVKQRADEQLCRDCAKKKLKTWYAYEIDARQILGALGCTERPADTMICDGAEARAAAAANCR